MPSFKLTWEAKLLKVSPDNTNNENPSGVEDNPSGEHIGQYSGYITFDNLLFAQKASTVAGEQLFQQIIEHSMQSQEVAPEVASVDVANDAALKDNQPEPPVETKPKSKSQARRLNANKKGA